MTVEGWHHVWSGGDGLFLARGLLVTLELLGISAIVSLLLGSVLAAYRHFAKGVARWPGAFYVGAFRNLPVLVVMFFVRFGLPLAGVNLTSAFIAAIVALVLYNTAMIAEILRGTLNSVSRGQTEAALATGCSQWTAFWRVVFPQGMSRALPALTGQMIVLLQGTSLVTALGVADLTNNAAVIYSQYINPLETLLTIIAIYFLMCSALARVRDILERRAAH